MSTMPEFEPPDASREGVGARLQRLERGRRAAIESTSPESQTGALPRRADEPPTPRAWRERLRDGVRSPAAAAAAGAALVLAVVLAVPAVHAAAADARQQDAAALVGDYVAAIERGDADAANALFMPDSDLASTALLVDEAMPDDVELEVIEVVVEGDRAAAEVEVVATRTGALAVTTVVLRHDDTVATVELQVAAIVDGESVSSVVWYRAVEEMVTVFVEFEVPTVSGDDGASQTLDIEDAG